jgi:hypothetical protein
MNLTRRLPCLAASFALAGCGGGVYLEFSDFDDLPPEVSLAAASASAPAGSRVRLVAAAADESGIERVAFYRYDGNTAVRLGSDGAAPYEWSLVVPADGRASVSVFAEAVDNEGNRNDSALVDIAILP